MTLLLFLDSGCRSARLAWFGYSFVLARIIHGVSARSLCGERREFDPFLAWGHNSLAGS